MDRTRLMVPRAPCFVVVLFLFASHMTVAEKSMTEGPGKSAEQSITTQETSISSKSEDTLFKGMKYRVIGPFRGGRSLTASGIPGDPTTYYFGATGGGL